MSSSSRPGKRDPAPPPYYLTYGNEVRYCFTCGRVISSKKVQQKQQNPIKYCSDSCRRNKPGEDDERIEQLITSLLNGQLSTMSETLKQKPQSTKGDRRIIVSCDEIERVLFPRDGELRVDSSTDDENPALQIPIAEATQVAQGPNHSRDEHSSDITEELLPNGAASMANKQLEGQKQAERRERVRRAARRAVVFGLMQQQSSLDSVGKSTSKGNTNLDRKMQSESENIVEAVRHKCEAVQLGRVVEPSFAKGEWGIRWRE